MLLPVHCVLKVSFLTCLRAWLAQTAVLVREVTRLESTRRRVQVRAPLQSAIFVQRAQRRNRVTSVP